jgi:hypothetical protein
MAGRCGMAWFAVADWTELGDGEMDIAQYFSLTTN